MKLMFLGDKILGGTSAYSKVGDETCKRLAQLGHKVAHIPMGFANRMGIQVTQEGVQIYPSGANAFGEDVAVEHYLNFKADMLISIKEPWCVPPETLLQTPIGYYKIKAFIEQGLWKFLKVKTSNGFSKTLATHKIRYDANLVEIQTFSGKKLQVTKDNLIYVHGKGWLLPSKIKIGDGVIVASKGCQFGQKVGDARIGYTQELILPENTLEGYSEPSWSSNQVYPDICYAHLGNFI